MNRFVDEALLAKANAHAVEYLQALPGRLVGATAGREDLLRELDVPLSDNGQDAARVLDLIAAQGERGTMASAGPRYFGFVIGGSLPVAVATDWLASAWDQNCGSFVTSPVISVVEEVTRRWLLDLLRLPVDAGVGFVTGCQMANFTCLAAARHAVLRKAGWNVEEYGLIGAPRVNLILGAEAHITIYSSLRMLGFGTQAVQHIPTDDQGRMRADELRRTLEHTAGPTIVCAQAGNVNSGAVDPLREVAAIVREHDGWLHVDGAFGLWARASRDRAPLVDGAELADSWATDGHKWLNVPYDSGVAIVRDAAVHRASMTVTAAYLEQTAGEKRDPIDWVPELSRRARALPLYATLLASGRAGVEDLVDRLCARAGQIAELLGRDARVQILNDVVLNQVLVRFGNDDDLTRRIVSGVQREGTCWLAGTTWHDMAAMRVSVSNWATTEQDIERSAAAILRVLNSNG